MSSGITTRGGAFPSLSSGDIPNNAANTTGKAAKTDALNSATTVVNVAAATAPTTGQVLTAVDGTHATWQAAAGGISQAVADARYILLDGSNPSGPPTLTSPTINGLNVNRRVVVFADSPVSVLETDGVVLVNASAGNIVINLPNLSAATNLSLRIKKIDSSANTVAVASASEQFIDGAASFVLTAQYQSRDLQAGPDQDWFLF